MYFNIFLIKYYQKIEKIKLGKNDISKSTYLFTDWNVQDAKGTKGTKGNKRPYAHAQLYVIEI